jgi:hypothetical protein
MDCQSPHSIRKGGALYLFILAQATRFLRKTKAPSANALSLARFYTYRDHGGWFAQHDALLARAG